jgi:nitrilase
VWAIPLGEGGTLSELYAQLVANAVEIPGPATECLCQTAKRANVHIVIGVNERNIEASGASLYNSLLVIDAQGNILGVHRKLMPTGASAWCGAGGTAARWKFTIHLLENSAL